MNTIRALVLAAGAVAAAGAELPAGTQLFLRLDHSITTKIAREGDLVNFTTAAPIISEGRIVLPAGSYVRGAIKATRRGGRMFGDAELEVELQYLAPPTGEVTRFAPRIAAVRAGGNSELRSRGATIRRKPTRTEGERRVAGLFAVTGGLILVPHFAFKYEAPAFGLVVGSGTGYAVGALLTARRDDIDLRTGTVLEVVLAEPVELASGPPAGLAQRGGE